MQSIDVTMLYIFINKKRQLIYHITLYLKIRIKVCVFNIFIGNYYATHCSYQMLQWLVSEQLKKKKKKGNCHVNYSHKFQELLD